MEEKYENTGFLPDNRPPRLRDKDYKHEELSFGEGAKYVSKDEAKKAEDLYKKLDQRSTSSCVAHSASLALGIDNELEGEGFVELSPAYIYRQRFNYAGEGMYYYDVGNICSQKGDCLETTLPTPKTESKINRVSITQAMIDEAQKYKAKSYIFMNNPTIDSIKDVVNGPKKGLLISIYANYDEWSQEYPEVKNPNLTINQAPINHCITVLPNSAYDHKGKKYVIVQDSAWFGGKNIRHLSEDFIKARVKHGLYFINLDNPNPIPKKEAKISFQYTFDRYMRVGMSGEDVKMLQMALKELGFFTYPVCTGYFGGITRKAVIEFQEYYANDVLKFFGLTQGTGYVGRTTIAKLYKLMGM